MEPVAVAKKGANQVKFELTKEQFGLLMAILQESYDACSACGCNDPDTKLLKKLPLQDLVEVAGGKKDLDAALKDLDPEEVPCNEKELRKLLVAGFNSFNFSPIQFIMWLLKKQSKGQSR